MNQHYSEADLLETWYTAPGESLPVTMHLADCTDCAARWERLDGKIRGLAASGKERPERFWEGQRHSIMHTIEQRRSRPAVPLFRPMALAFAAVLALVLTLTALSNWKWTETAIPTPAATAVVATIEPVQPAAELPVATDPWESDELSDLQSLVAWESWIEPGDQSL